MPAELPSRQHPSQHFVAEMRRPFFLDLHEVHGGDDATRVLVISLTCSSKVAAHPPEDGGAQRPGQRVDVDVCGSVSTRSRSCWTRNGWGEGQRIDLDLYGYAPARARADRLAFDATWRRTPPSG